MASPSHPWQPWWAAMMVGHVKPRRRVIFVNTGRTLVPRGSDDTSVRRGCRDEQVDGPVSARGHVSRRMPTAITAYLLKMSPGEGRVSCGEEWAGGVTCPSSQSFSSSSSSPRKDSGSKGVSSPHALVVAQVVLQARPLCLRTCSHSL
jgi:hypothetical protein